MSVGRESMASQIARKQSEAQATDRQRQEARTASDEEQQRKKALQPHIAKIMRATTFEAIAALRGKPVTPGKDGYLGIVAISQTGGPRFKGYADGCGKQGVLLHSFGTLVAFSDLDRKQSYALVNPRIEGPATDDQLAPTSSIDDSVGVEEQPILVGWRDSLTDLAICVSEGERYDPHWWGGTHKLH
jgi:hypothetical protein